MSAIQTWPAADGWQNHVAEMALVPAEMVHIAAQGRNEKE
jgi:hypothetical protein